MLDSHLWFLGADIAACPSLCLFLTLSSPARYLSIIISLSSDAINYVAFDFPTFL